MIDAWACCGLATCERPDAARPNAMGCAGADLRGFGDCDGGFMLAKAIIRKTCIEPDIVVIDMPGFRAHKN